MRSRLRHPLPAALAALSAAAGVALAAVPAPNPGPALSASVVPADHNASSASWAVHDASGRLVRKQAWRVTDVGGNCCEVYVRSDAAGRLYEYGGNHVHVSTDRGRTWRRVATPGALLGGEGSLVVAPNGDVLGATWDPYTGDALQTVKYTAATGTWQALDLRLRTPFFDRPWVTLVPGPVTVAGRRVPYATLLRGGYPYSELAYVSADGLRYDQATAVLLDTGSTPTSYAIPVVRNAAADRWAPPALSGDLSLNAGGVLHEHRLGEVAGCSVARLNTADSRWVCVDTTLGGTVRQDSRGWLVRARLATGGTAWLLDTSRDGGRTWSTVALRPPGGGTIEAFGGGIDNAVHDLAVDGRLGRAALLTRFERPRTGKGQDMVFHVDTRSARPRLLATYLLGTGDLVTGNSATSTGSRIDFASITLLPDGKIAASFDDSGGGAEPRLAIQP